MSQVNLLGWTPATLAAEAQARGVALPLGEARRIQAHLIAEGQSDLDTMARPISKARRAALADHFCWDRPQVIEEIPDPSDDSTRVLFRAADGALFEAVRIGLEKPDHFTACLSSQAGCAMGCDFCATGRLGLARHLSSAEIVGAFCALRDRAPGRVSGAVFMGQGEPFHNYDAVMQAAAVLNHPCGGRIDRKSITLSTVGLVPQLRAYAASGARYKLIVSLTSALPEKRRALLPIASKWSLEELADALRTLQDAGHGLTLAWVLMGGVNDGADEVAALARALDGLRVRINVIDVNDSRPDGYRRATPAEREAFIDALAAHNLPFTLRYSVGRATDSACGMLASRRLTASA